MLSAVGKGLRRKGVEGGTKAEPTQKKWRSTCGWRGREASAHDHDLPNYKLHMKYRSDEKAGRVHMCEHTQAPLRTTPANRACHRLALLRAHGSRSAILAVWRLKRSASTACTDLHACTLQDRTALRPRARQLHTQPCLMKSWWAVCNACV